VSERFIGTAVIQITYIALKLTTGHNLT
jgi:hypothetical protein